MARVDSAFLFRVDLRWPADKESKPFYTVPAWWRRFIFQVLSPRELTVYHYYLSVLNTAGVAFPTDPQILADLCLVDSDSVTKGRKQLVKLGFLLKPTDAEVSEFSMGSRPVYQRPCVQHTIRELLREQIDGELFPTDNKLRTEHAKTSASVVDAGIKHMLGDAYKHYKNAFAMRDAERDDRLKRVLAQLLDEDLERRKTAAAEARKAGAKTVNLDDLATASPGLKAAWGLAAALNRPKPPKPRKRKQS
jgi:hypothetical protein